MSPEWKSFDPSWLIKLAEIQFPDDSWLIESLERCQKASFDGVSYYFFVERERADDQNSEWEFARNIKLRDSEKGEIVLDILKNNWIGGMEYLEQYEKS